LDDRAPIAELEQREGAFPSQRAGLRL